MRQDVKKLIRGSGVKSGVSALVVVKACPFLQATAELGAAADGMQVKVVVFDGPTGPEKKLMKSQDFLPISNRAAIIMGVLGSIIGFLSLIIMDRLYF